ncbi:iron-sulfur cluster assembly scaffold protein [Candidatus Woesearchaeota archaeon]|nr:iron-sulfur cluster assembly scaffold protein [Candidatus Woesearchaeota archaeon]
MNYNEKLIELFRNPQHTGEVENASGIGEVGNMKCGDVMKVSLKIENDKIKEIKFLTFGCVAAIASSEALCRIAKDKSIEEAEKLTNQDILNYVGEVPALKVHCSVLGEEALKSALKDYKQKNAKIN